MTSIQFIATVLLLIGISLVLLALSFRDDNKKFFTLLVLASIIGLNGVYFFFFETERAREAFVALSTILVAIVAIIALVQNRNLRVDSIKREQRDRKERKLIIIIEWATDIAKCESAIPLTPLPIELLDKSLPLPDKEKIIAYHNDTERTNVIMKYQSLDAIGKRIVLIAKSLDKQFGCNLKNLTQKTAKKLEAHVELGYKWVAGEFTDDEYNKHWRILVRNAMSLAEKAEKVID